MKEVHKFDALVRKTPWT